MSQHRYRRGNQHFAVVFRDGHWWRSNWHGEFTLISPRYYALPPGLFPEPADRDRLREILVAGAAGMALAVVLTRLMSRG